MSGIVVSDVRFEHHHNGFGLGYSRPRISWLSRATDTELKDWRQTSYEVEISKHGQQVESFKVDTSDSVLVPWLGNPLISRERCKVRVRVSGQSGTDTPDTSDWSDWAAVECAFLERKQFVGKFIGAREPQVDGPLRPILLRKVFDIPEKDRETARLYITAYGVYQAYINGGRVDAGEMAPGWTSYSHRHNYQVVDVTGLLLPGKNVVAIEVAEGWYAGRLGWSQKRHFYGKELGAFVQLEFRDEDGVDIVTVISDESWMYGNGSLVSSEIYDGEVFDDQQTPDGWNDNPSFDDSTWTPAKVLPFTKARLIASDAPPVTQTQTIEPLDMITTKSGRTVLDFGQNLVGKLFVPELLKPRGHKIIFRHAEVMEAGELGVRPLRTARATDTIISAGRKISNWSPRHTFHGFRYVQVDGWSPKDEQTPLTLESIRAVVMHTDMRRTGWFTCSEPLVNKLHENTLWSMRGNFLSIPTDCPQRDERLGWTGDIQVFGPSANFLYDTRAMLGDWLEDVAAEQATFDGVPPFVVPNILSSDWGDGSWGNFPQAVWDDVVILLPWALYRAFGDRDILSRQYPSMQSWLDKGVKRAPDGLWDPTFHQLGDWLDPSAPPNNPGEAKTDGTFVADAYLLHVTKTMSQICDLLNKPEDKSRYTADYERLKKAFDNKYLTPAGLLAADTQTGLALALHFNLMPSPTQAHTAATRLARSVQLANFKVATGFAGTPIITHALSSVGHQNLAYRMLLETSCPSWLYPITQGATTIWERWDSMLQDGSVNQGEMTSFNHYALGSVVNWLHEVVGGISPLDPGWRHVLVRPVPGGSLTSAEVRHDSPYGRVSCAWKMEQEVFRMQIEIPLNCRATVVLPDRQKSRVLGEEEQGMVVGSGRYEFSCPWVPERWKPRRIPIPFYAGVEDEEWFD